MKTAAHYESFVSPVLGSRVGAFPSPRDIVNACGKYIFSLRLWKFRRRPPYAISLTSSQEYVSLPTDFGQLQSIYATGTTMDFQIVEMDELVDLRRNSITSQYGYRVAVVQPGQTSASAEMAAPRLEIWPTPSASASSAAKIVYYANWTELTAPSDKVNIPAWAEPVMYTLIPEWAAGTADGNLMDRQDRFGASKVLAAAISMDGLMQTTAGRVRNGLLAHNERFNPYDTTVSGP